MIAARFKRIGVTGILGAALLLFAEMHFLSAALPERERLAALRNDVSSFGAPSQGNGSERADPAQDLAAFYRFFRKSASVSAALARLEASILDSGLAFETAEYRLGRESSLALARYEVIVPLRGTYAEVRSFVGLLLERMPQVALEGVAIKRDSVGSSRIEARLRLSIYLALP